MHRGIRRAILAAALGSVAFVTGASAAPHEVRVPLHDGKLHVEDLSSAVCREMHLPAFDLPGAEVDLSGVSGLLFVRGVNAALGDGCRVSVDADAIVLHVDAEKLPARVDDAKRAVRTFTAEVAPKATARQAAHWGLWVPKDIDAKRPLVVLVHGLDCERQRVGAIGDLLQQAGYQVGYFSYPDDGPIEEDVQRFSDRMAGLHRAMPDLKIDVVAHSMGGLVARGYIEGHDYTGGVDRLILIGTPNAGSNWASYRFGLELQEQLRAMRQDKDWSWTWAITDGLGEAGRDLKPHSKFLEKLNAAGRRAGVRYTVVAGNQTVASRVESEWATAVVKGVPTAAQNWWGLRQARGGLEHLSDRLREATSDADGPVNVSSAALAGVEDIVILPADHITLIYPDHGKPPAAWDVIRDRLAKP